MEKRYNYKNLKWLWLSVLLILLDMGTKYWIRTHFLMGELLSIFPGFNCYYISNSGLAFGLFSNVSLNYRWLFMCVTILVIIVFIVILYQSIDYPKYHSIAYSMIIGGALGNLFDRILYGVVVDFIDIYIKNWHWPTFNIADIAICVGIIILIKKYYYNFFKNNLN